MDLFGWDWSRREGIGLSLMEKDAVCRFQDSMIKDRKTLCYFWNTSVPANYHFF